MKSVKLRYKFFPTKMTLKDYPEILAYWDFDKNGSIDPLTVAARSNTKYAWKCPKCHQSFELSPDHMIRKKTKCPICANYKVVKGVNDLSTLRPGLMLDWDYVSNKGIDPSTLSIRSTKTVHWKCHTCGFDWTRRVNDSASKKINCPKCSRRDKANQRHLFELKRRGPISDRILLLDWDYEKNARPPSKYTSQSNEAVYWKCHICGHGWKAKINNRANGRGCPCCGHKQVVPGKNDLETLCPDIAKEWHPTRNYPLTPRDVLPGANRKVWWLCPRGHEYQATLNHRTQALGTNCPHCVSGRQTSFREQAIFYYLRKMYPDAINRYKPDGFGALELDIFLPSIRVGIEYDGVAWHKKEKFEREQRKYALCKKSGITLVRVKEKMPEELGLELADEMLSIGNVEVEEQFVMLIHSVLARFDFSFSYWTHPMDVNLRRDRFEIMTYATEIKDSFAEKYPDLAKEWHPTKNGKLKPTMFSPKNDFKAWWICPTCGLEYEQAFVSRANGFGCPECGKMGRAKKRIMNHIKKHGCITNPLLLKEWHPTKNGDLKPSDCTKQTTKKVWWLCSRCGYEWEEEVYHREKGRRCPRCADLKLIPGENDFATRHPELLTEWDYGKNKDVDPHKVHHAANKKVWWICSKCGHEYFTTIRARAQGSGCRKCADKANPDLLRKKRLREGKSLADKHPELIKEYCADNPLPPNEILFGTHQKAHWKCSKCGNEWYASVASRSRGSGCPVCGRIKCAESRRKKAKKE